MAKRVKPGQVKFRTILGLGPGTSGKTEAIGHLAKDGKVLLLSVEMRNESIDDQIANGSIVAAQCDSIKAFSEEFKRLKKAHTGGQSVYEDDGEKCDYKDFKYVAVDSYTALVNMIVDQEVEMNTHGLQAFGKATKRVQLLKEKLDKLPLHVYWTCQVDRHERQKGFLYTARVPGKSMKALIGHGLSAIVGFKQEPNKDDKVIYTSKTDEYPELMDHTGRLGKTEPYDLAALFNKTTKQKEKVKGVTK